MNYGVDRYKRLRPCPAEEERASRSARNTCNLRSTICGAPCPADAWRRTQRVAFPEEPQENILYFIEKNAPLLEPWQREVVRIVRKIGQYFYPQRQTQVMNEGWATFWHYTLLNGSMRGSGDRRLHDGVAPVPHQRGLPAALRRALLQRHQPLCPRLRDDARYPPHLRGPTDEDRHWFPDIAGQDWHKVLDFAMRNYKDESFIAQYLSPTLMREFRFFGVQDDDREDSLEITAIHDEAG